MKFEKKPIPIKKKQKKKKERILILQKIRHDFMKNLQGFDERIGVFLFLYIYLIFEMVKTKMVS